MKRSLLVKNCQTFSTCSPKTKRSKNTGELLSIGNAFKLLFVMVAFSCLAYIFQINQLATMGQEINLKEQALKELREENKTLEIKVAQLKSSYHFENERERLNLVSPDQVSFVEIGEQDAVAMID